MAEERKEKKPRYVRIIRSPLERALQEQKVTEQITKHVKDIAVLSKSLEDCQAVYGKTSKSKVCKDIKESIKTKKEEINNLQDILLVFSTFRLPPRKIRRRN